MKANTLLRTLKKDIKDGTSYSVSYLTQNEVEKTLSKKGIQIRKVFAPLLRQVYKTQTDYKLKKGNTCYEPHKESKIYVVNHRQADDIVLGANAVGKSGYIVFGNKDLAIETSNGLGLWAYGMILLDRDDSTSRKSTYEKMKYVLNNNGNIIIYPEGYWNLADDGLADARHGADQHNSENWLIQDINVGIVRLAKETGCPIIPTILHYDEVETKKCYSQKGHPIYVGEEDNIFTKKDEVVESMTTIYYNLMNKYSEYKRNELEKDGVSLRDKWEMLKQELISDCDIPRIGYKLDLANEKLIGKAKVANPIITSVEVFEPINNLAKGRQYIKK